MNFHEKTPHSFICLSGVVFLWAFFFLTAKLIHMAQNKRTLFRDVDAPSDHLTKSSCELSTLMELWGPIGFSWIFCFCFFPLWKVKECYSPLLSEAQQLSVPLEELETQITSFYDSLGKINEIISVLEREAQSSSLFKQKHQVRKIPFRDSLILKVEHFWLS